MLLLANVHFQSEVETGGSPLVILAAPKTMAEKENQIQTYEEFSQAQIQLHKSIPKKELRQMVPLQLTVKPGG